MGDLFANVIAGLALGFTAITWWVDKRRGKRNERRQDALDDAQTALRQRQLELNEKLLAYTQEAEKKADIRASLSRLRWGNSEHSLTLRNAGRGPAFQVVAELSGNYSHSGGWMKEDTYSVDFVLPESGPVDRLDPDSPPYTMRFKTAFGGFIGPVSVTVKWRDHSSEKEQLKRLSLTPEDPPGDIRSAAL